MARRFEATAQKEKVGFDRQCSKDVTVLNEVLQHERKTKAPGRGVKDTRGVEKKARRREIFKKVLGGVEKF